eukprot:Hpha_TRINITY_DN6090_c0_g1::TRINITY_DN6090_c0_g1_i1::g.63462::m.63462
MPSPTGGAGVADPRRGPQTVTVFSLSGCPHCIRAKTLLGQIGQPFTEISLSDYPEKRSDMLALADRITVPQVFIGNLHIGGAAELTKLHEEGRLEATLRDSDTIARLDDRLLPPTYPPRPQPELPKHEEQEICLVGTECGTYSDIVNLLARKLDITDRSGCCKSAQRTFTGCHLVDVLMSSYKLRTRPDAVQAGDQLLNSGLIRHVPGVRAFEDSDQLYRLQAHEDPMILNRTRVSDRPPPQAPILFVKSLAKQLRSLRQKHTTEGGVDYLAMVNDPEFRQWADGTVELQRVDIKQMNEDSRLAFVINLYNVAIIHAFSVVGIPSTDWQRYNYFDDVKYDVGGLVYSLNDLENGLLRGNRNPPYHLFKPFGGSDPRREVMLRSPDNRIHFALNCGAKSCPPVKDFTAEAVREELRIAASAFCNDMEEHCKVDEGTGTLWLSQIFAWYSVDFGGGGLATAKEVLQHMRGEKKEALERMIASKRVSVKHLDYDWGTDAATGKHLKFTSAGSARDNATGTKSKSCCSVM